MRTSIIASNTAKTLVILCFFLYSCGKNKEIVYSFENNAGAFEFESTNPDTVIKEQVNFWTMEVRTRKDDPVYVNFIFAEGTPNVEKLQSIKTHLYTMDELGNYVEQKAKIELKVDYYDGKIIQQVFKKDNETPLNKLVDWKKANYTYEFLGVEYPVENNIVTYNFTNKYFLDEFPDTLKVRVDFKWDNGERSYESFMVKGEYTPAGWNLKY